MSEFEKVAGEVAGDVIDQLEKFAQEQNYDITREEIVGLMDAFSEELEKSANWRHIGQHIGDGKMLKDVGGVAKETVVKGLSGFGLGVGLMGAIGAANKIKDGSNRRAFDKALDDVKRNSSVVRDADPEKVERFANTIHRFAPTASSDPNLLASVLGQAVQYESIDQQTLKSLVELEARMSSFNQIRPRDIMA